MIIFSLIFNTIQYFYWLAMLLFAEYYELLWSYITIKFTFLWKIEKTVFSRYFLPFKPNWSCCDSILDKLLGLWTYSLNNRVMNFSWIPSPWNHRCRSSQIRFLFFEWNGWMIWTNGRQFIFLFLRASTDRGPLK